jgi:hypothetical protein
MRKSLISLILAIIITAHLDRPVHAQNSPLERIFANAKRVIGGPAFPEPNDALPGKFFGPAKREPFNGRVAGLGWASAQATGPPNTPGFGDIQSAWASATPDATDEWLELR